MVSGQGFGVPTLCFSNFRHVPDQLINVGNPMPLAIYHLGMMHTSIPPIKLVILDGLWHWVYHDIKPRVPSVKPIWVSNCSDGNPMMPITLATRILKLWHKMNMEKRLETVEGKNEDILWCLKIFEDIWWYCMHWKSPVIASQTWNLVNSQGLKVWAFVSWSRLFLPGNNAWQLWRPKGGCAWKCLMKYPRFISSNLIVKLM